MSINQGNEAKISRILGVDYGRAKVGLAIADSETKIASAFGVLENNREIFEKLTRIVKKEGVDIVVIGIPSRLNKEETEYEAEDFGHTLGNLNPEIKIEFENEMFTTKMAKDNLIEKGIKGIGKFDDQEAARIILQSWLDKTVNNNQ